MDIVWFENPDLDLNGTLGNETAVFTAPGTVVQTDEDGLTTATYTSSLAPTAWQLELGPNIQSSLDNGTLTTNLTNAMSSVGSGNARWAFQYNFSNLEAGNSVSYTTTLSLTQVPTPSSMLLFGTGLAGLALWRWRKSATKS